MPVSIVHPQSQRQRANLAPNHIGHHVKSNVVTTVAKSAKHPASACVQTHVRSSLFNSLVVLINIFLSNNNHFINKVARLGLIDSAQGC